MKVLFHEKFYERYTQDPAAAPGRLEAVMKVIEPHVELVEAEPADPEDIRAVHTESHIEWVRGEGLYEISALAAGGAVQAAVLGMQEPCFGLIRPPGHHASPDSAWGFCFFSNMAIAMCHLLRTGRVKSGHVLDFDMHFGDGTVNALLSTPEVTIHNPSTPDRKAYLREVEARLNECRADVIGISAGFDDHVEDWGGTLLTSDFTQMGRLVRERAKELGAGCFAILEGGYNHEVLGHNALALIQGLGGA
ncbi:MAG: histone deacetylase family protein [bacterium]